MAGVDALVAKVAGDLEYPLVPPDHQALEIELGGDAQAEVDIEGVGVGHEGPGQRSAGLGLEYRGVDLDELLGQQLRAQGRYGLEPDVEHPAAVRIGEEIDLALPVAGVGGGQPVPLVGERAQGLGQQPQSGHVDRELPRRLVMASPSAPIQSPRSALASTSLAWSERAECLHQQLDRAGDVLEGGEGELSVATDAGQTTGHLDDLAGSDVGLQVAMALPQFGGGGGAVEPERIGVNPLFRQHLSLLASLGAQHVERRRILVLATRLYHSQILLIGSPR